MAPSSPSKLTQGLSYNISFCVRSKGIEKLDLKIFPYLEKRISPGYYISTYTSILSPSPKEKPLIVNTLPQYFYDRIYYFCDGMTIHLIQSCMRPFRPRLFASNPQISQ